MTLLGALGGLGNEKGGAQYDDYELIVHLEIQKCSKN